MTVEKTYDMSEEFDPNRLLIHLNHPCHDMDTWYAENDTDVELGKRQGYVTLAELRTIQAELTQTKAILAAVQDQRDEAYRQRAAANAVVDAAIEWRKRCGEGEPNAFAQAALVEAVDAAISGLIPQDSVLFRCSECQSITTDLADVKALETAYNQLKAAQQWQQCVEDVDLRSPDGKTEFHTMYCGTGLFVDDGDVAILPQGYAFCKLVQP